MCQSHRSINTITSKQCPEIILLMNFLETNVFPTSTFVYFNSKSLSTDKSLLNWLVKSNKAKMHNVIPSDAKKNIFSTVAAKR